MGNTRDQYLQYAKKIVSVLSDEAFYNQYKNKVEAGASNIKMYKKRLIQNISIDWIDTIEDCLPNLDTIVRNPRKFIVQEEDIVDVSLARSISTESIKHLAQHTNMISKVDKDGSVTPNKILNITKEESFEIYENRFIYTLLLKLKDFVTMRYDKIKKASATQEVLQLDVESRFNLPSKKVSYRTEYMAQLSFDEVMQLDPETLTKVERVAKIDRIITDFLSSTFAKAMRSCAPVRPPITRTNVILKEPNFKKALTLWQFVETYQLTGGFATSDEIENCDLETDEVANLHDMVALNSMLFESLYDHTDQESKMEDTAFVDIMRIGELDFLPDKVVRDPWAQKMEDKLKVDEDEKEKEVEKEKSEELEAQGEEKPKEQKENKPEDKVEDKKEDQEQDKKDKSDEREQGDEENEKDRQTETPPKDWEDEDDDDEPNEAKFDKNLFQVKLLYKRPKEDRLRQEEIGRIKDAIDRCLALYRKQKKNESDELLQEKKRKHLSERAEALRRQRDEEMLSRGIGDVLGDSFTSQAAKIVLPKQNEEIEKDEIDNIEEKPAINKKVKLEVGNMNLNEQKIDAGFKFDNLEENKTELKVTNKVENEIKQKPTNKVENDTQDIKRKIAEPKNPWALSNTTINQKYSNATGKNANLETVDEKLVSVGKNPLKMSSANDILGGTFGSDKAKIIIKRKPEKETSKIENTAELNDTIENTKNSVKNKNKLSADKIENETKQNSDNLSVKKVKSENKNQNKNINSSSESENNEDLKNNKNEIINEKAVKSESIISAKKSKDNNTDLKSITKNIRIAKETNDPWSLSNTTLNQKYSRPSGKKSDFEVVDEKKVAVGKVNVQHKNVTDILGADVFGGKVEINIKTKKNTTKKDNTKNLDKNADVTDKLKNEDKDNE